MVLVSFPITFSVVKRRRTVSCVKRQKKNSSSPAFSNQSLAVSEWMCRLHIKANQTLASRKFNVFIDLFVGQLNLGTFGDDQGKLNPSRTRSLTFQKYAPNACQNQFSDGAALGGGLFLQLSVKRFRNINGCANGFLLHKTNYLTDAINMEWRRSRPLPISTGLPDEPSLVKLLCPECQLNWHLDTVPNARVRRPSILGRRESREGSGRFPRASGSR